MASSKGRIAVVVVHGMGNQYPMETLRGFVNSMRPSESVLYSSPNRITTDMELRRLSFSKIPFDFFEYYWAQHIQEPGFSEVLSWSLKLLFVKTPSNSLKKHINAVRLAIIIFAVLVVAIATILYLSFKDQIDDLLSITIYGASLLVIFKIIWSIISATVAGAIQSSIGDVIKYTIPSPGNIAIRDKIRKNGIELIRNLHNAKKPDGSNKYSKVVLVAHSLGTIVAYDILTSLFAEYHVLFKNVPPQVSQSFLDKIRVQYDDPDHGGNQYQKDQAQLFNEYQGLGNQWRVSHFITMGSPLTHASMILSKGLEDFKRKKDQREFPVSPPQLDHADNHFSFDASYMATDDSRVTVKILHHAAHFAMTRWTNIYYENDWIGGQLSDEFGKGIVDIPVRAKRKWVRSIPLATHTRYWDVENDEGLKVLKEILEKELK